MLKSPLFSLWCLLVLLNEELWLVVIKASRHGSTFLSLCRHSSWKLVTSKTNYKQQKSFKMHNWLSILCLRSTSGIMACTKCLSWRDFTMLLGKEHIFRKIFVWKQTTALKSRGPFENKIWLLTKNLHEGTENHIKYLSRENTLWLRLFLLGGGGAPNVARRWNSSVSGSLLYLGWYSSNNQWSWWEVNSSMNQIVVHQTVL
jgi:hypothetical protein